MGEKPSKDQKPSVLRLIDIQRRLAASKSPFLRCIGTLLAAGVLHRRLADLTDKQVGQLLQDHVGRDLGITEPESTICCQATQRLFRSESGSLEEEPPLRPPCPRCGTEMIFNFGIDERDFLECTSLHCGNREYVPIYGAGTTEENN
jgi:hypothetical protein